MTKRSDKQQTIFFRINTKKGRKRGINWIFRLKKEMKRKNEKNEREKERKEKKRKGIRREKRGEQKEKKATTKDISIYVSIYLSTSPGGTYSSI